MDFPAIFIHSYSVTNRFKEIYCKYCQRCFLNHNYVIHLESKAHLFNEFKHRRKNDDKKQKAYEEYVNILPNDLIYCECGSEYFYNWQKAHDCSKHHKLYEAARANIRKQFKDKIEPKLMAAVWHPRNIARFGDWGVDVDLS